MSTNSKGGNALIFAPLPPPVGGIASITAMLYEGLGNHSEIIFVQPVIKNSSVTTNLSRVFGSLKLLVSSTFRIKKKGKVLFFSSAYGSFWEKLVWARIVLFLGREPVIIMVDGNFPRFYETFSNVKRRLVSILISNKNFTIGAQSLSWNAYYKGIFSHVNIQTVSASVAKEFFLNSKELSRHDSPLTILYLGWIIEDKGILDLLDAISLIKHKTIGVKFQLTGPLFGRDEFWANECTKRNIQDVVNFKGALVGQEAILKEYKNADIFVYPSHFEGFPVAVLEAITIGLPCIGTNVGGISDILEDGITGIVVEPHSPKQIAEGILKLYDNLELRNNYSQRAVNRAKTNYNFANLIKSYKAILNIHD